MKTRRKNYRRRNSDDPTIRLNISMSASDHETLVAEAERRHVSLSAFLSESGLKRSEYEGLPRAVDQLVVSDQVLLVMGQIVTLLGPMSMSELMDLFNRSKQTPKPHGP